MSPPRSMAARLQALAQRLQLDPVQQQRLQTLADHGAESVLVEIVDTLEPTPELELELPPPTRDPDLPERIGPYPVLGRLGSGGMGEVLQVRDPSLGRTMALKLLRARRAVHPGARARFLAEARATARLQHPGIVPIHALGELPDGRLWYTMEQVRGRTLGDVILDLHGVSTLAGRWAETSDGWTLRRLVEALHRACQAVAYAHTQGVVHRDLKPANIMVGSFGEVRVLDWGIAKLLDSAEEALGPITAADEEPLQTRDGVAVGTPVTMAPEQARGELDRVGPATDVHALGMTLYELLAGHPAPWAPGRRIRRRQDPVPPRPPHAPGPVPSELIDILLRATATEPQDRYPDAQALAAALAGWLEGAQRRERALALVDKADRMRPGIHHARERARALAALAQEQLDQVPSHAPIADKRGAWRQQDRARDQARQARQAELEYHGLLRQALEVFPGLQEAQDRLADLHRERHALAEAEGDSERAAEEEALLRRHGARRHARYLAGEGALSLVTEPPGASVRLHRFVEEDRRLVLHRAEELGLAPLYDHPLDPGSYLCELVAPGRDPVRYPVFIRRREHWDGIPPGGHAPQPVLLPSAGSLGPDDVYVPAGWFWSGSRDTVKRDALPWRRLWADAFVIRRYPVTNREYIDFLDDLVGQGREPEALRWVPRYAGSMDAPGAMIYGRRADGGFELVPDAEGDLWGLDWPVLKITVRGAEAYARWFAEREALPWRLPGELEWEKAARGVDGRIYPWGDHPEPTYANLRGSREGGAYPADVGAVATDVSPYGVRDIAGGACDYCIDSYKVEGPATGRKGRVLDPTRGGDRRAGRGGSWTWPIPTCRLDYRTQHSALHPRSDTSFRLLRPFLQP